MIRRCFLLVMIALLSCNGVLAREKEQVTNLFEGDSLAVLSEEQNKILNSVIGLLIENDSIVFLPQEINEMIGDSAKVCYASYPDWQSAYFKKHREKDNCLFIPAYAETPYGIISSELYVEPKNEKEIDCTVETYLPIEGKVGMNMMYIASNIQGEFLRGKAYTEKDMRAIRLAHNQRYFENKRMDRRDYSRSDRYMSPINRATEKNYNYTDMDRILKRNWTLMNIKLKTKW